MSVDEKPVHRVACGVCGQPVFADRAEFAACRCGEEWWVCRPCAATPPLSGLPIAERLLSDHRVWCDNDQGQRGASVASVAAASRSKDHPPAGTRFFRVWIQRDDGTCFHESEFPAENAAEVLAITKRNLIASAFAKGGAATESLVIRVEDATTGTKCLEACHT